MIEQRVEVPTNDGSMPTFIFHPQDPGPYPVVLYMMDAPSIRPALRDMASRLASAGYYVMLPFLYYRHSPYKEFGTSDEEMHERGDLMRSVNRTDAFADVQALLDFAATSEFAQPDGAIGAVGFCMSGPLVLHLAQNMPERVTAIASIHGAWLVNDQPDSPHREIDQIRAEVYFGWADKDPTATAEEMQIMDEAMRDAGVNYELEFLPGALHGYAPPGGANYQREASERHWEVVHRMLQRNLSI